MSELRAARPMGLRMFNGVGAALRSVGVPLVRLDVDALLVRASERTRLDDFGDDTFREPLRRLVDSLEADARLTMLGRIVVRNDLVQLLENRLRLVDSWKRHPEILQREVRAPIF